MKKIVFDNNSIPFMLRNQDDYISLTDMAKRLPQPERLQKLNQIAISQMTVLESIGENKLLNRPMPFRHIYAILQSRSQAI